MKKQPTSTNFERVFIGEVGKVNYQAFIRAVRAAGGTKPTFLASFTGYDGVYSAKCLVAANGVEYVGYFKPTMLPNRTLHGMALSMQCSFDHLERIEG